MPRIPTILSTKMDSTEEFQTDGTGLGKIELEFFQALPHEIEWYLLVQNREMPLASICNLPLQGLCFSVRAQEALLCFLIPHQLGAL